MLSGGFSIISVIYLHKQLSAFLCCNHRYSDKLRYEYKWCLLLSAFFNCNLTCLLIANQLKHSHCMLSRFKLASYMCCLTFFIVKAELSAQSQAQSELSQAARGLLRKTNCIVEFFIMSRMLLRGFARGNFSRTNKFRTAQYIKETSVFFVFNSKQVYFENVYRK